MDALDGTFAEYVRLGGEIVPQFLNSDVAGLDPKRPHMGVFSVGNAAHCEIGGCQVGPVIQIAGAKKQRPLKLTHRFFIASGAQTQNPKSEIGVVAGRMIP